MGCTNNYNFKMPVTYPKVAIGTWSWGDVASGDNIVYGAKVNKAMAEEIFELAMEKNIFLWRLMLCCKSEPPRRISPCPIRTGS